VNRIDSFGNIRWGAGTALHETFPSGGENDADADGYGGVVAIWNYSTYLYAQRVDSNGIVLWNPTGVPVCTTMDTRNYQQVCSDHMGGAIAAWYGWYPGAQYPIYGDIIAQRVRADGTPGGVASGFAASLPPGRLSHKSYPNPFQQRARIKYQLPVRGKVSLKIYNIEGQLVRTRVNMTQEAGVHTVDWDGHDNAGKWLSQGVYFYRLKAGTNTVIGKLVLVK